MKAYKSKRKEVAQLLKKILTVIREHHAGIADRPVDIDPDLAMAQDVVSAMISHQHQCPACGKDEEDRRTQSALAMFAYLNTLGLHLGVGGPEDGEYAGLRVGTEPWWIAVLQRLQLLVPNQSGKARH